MNTKMMWIADADAEFLVGADGYPYECTDDQGNQVTLFHVSDDQIMDRTPGSVTRLLVVSDTDQKLWGALWYSLSTGTPGFTWDNAPTKAREGSGTTGNPGRWVGFQPVLVVEVVQEQYGLVTS